MFRNVSILFVFLIHFSLFAQPIKTKVTESGFDIKQDIQKEVQFEEARIFVYAGAGVGLRTGRIISGFLVNESPTMLNESKPNYRTTVDPDPFRFGLHAEAGVRYYLDNNFGIGAKGSLFYNSAKFIEPLGKATASTNIVGGYVEGLYRYFFNKTEQKTFLYGSLGLGVSILDQEQKYETANRTTSVSSTFFAVRPALGINIPIWDIFHFYAETGYNFSQGKISDGSLSLSQFQLAGGIHIRLNSF